jgi:hypothetical protein
VPPTGWNLTAKPASRNYSRSTHHTQDNSLSSFGNCNCQHGEIRCQIIEATLKALELEESEVNMNVLFKILSKTEDLTLNDRIFSERIYVPTGSIKLLDAKVLKAEDAAKYFVLFPNLPNELRT